MLKHLLGKKSSSIKKKRIETGNEYGCYTYPEIPNGIDCLLEDIPIMTADEIKEKKNEIEEIVDDKPFYDWCSLLYVQCHMGNIVNFMDTTDSIDKIKLVDSTESTSEEGNQNEKSTFTQVPNNIIIYRTAPIGTTNYVRGNKDNKVLKTILMNSEGFVQSLLDPSKDKTPTYNFDIPNTNITLKEYQNCEIISPGSWMLNSILDFDVIEDVLNKKEKIDWTSCVVDCTYVKKEHFKRPPRYQNRTAYKILTKNSDRIGNIKLFTGTSKTSLVPNAPIFSCLNKNDTLGDHFLSYNNKFLSLLKKSKKSVVYLKNFLHFISEQNPGKMCVIILDACSAIDFKYTPTLDGQIQPSIRMNERIHKDWKFKDTLKKDIFDLYDKLDVKHSIHSTKYTKLPGSPIYNILYSGLCSTIFKTMEIMFKKNNKIFKKLTTIINPKIISSIHVDTPFDFKDIIIILNSEIVDIADKSITNNIIYAHSSKEPGDDEIDEEEDLSYLDVLIDKKEEHKITPPIKMSFLDMLANSYQRANDKIIKNEIPTEPVLKQNPIIELDKKEIGISSEELGELIQEMKEEDEEYEDYNRGDEEEEDEDNLDYPYRFHEKEEEMEKEYKRERSRGFGRKTRKKLIKKSSKKLGKTRKKLIKKSSKKQ